MQYGLDYDVYKRVKDDKKEVIKAKEQPTILFVILIISILISRVIIFYDSGNVSGLAPFGLAYLIAVMMKKDKTKVMTATIGIIAGYFSISGNITYSYVNILAIALITAYYIIAQKINGNIKEQNIYLLILVSYFVYGFLINGNEIGVNLTLALINTIVVIPVYLVIKYGINCMEEFDTNYFFTTEEIISMGIVLCLVIAGIGNVGIMGVTLTNILSYVSILLIAYLGGAAYGSALGVAMGTIVGMNSGNITLCIAFYGMAGLIAGIFKDTGKVFSYLAYVIMYLGLSLYSQNLAITTIIEIMVAGVIFLSVPKKVLDIIEVEINNDRKMDKFNEVELNELKTEFGDKIEELGDALKLVSSTFANMGINNKLTYKNKSSALIENLADRVCGKCARCGKCWERNFNLTYNSFHELIKNCEEGNVIFPDYLEKVCLNKFELIKGGERIVDTLKEGEVVRSRLSDGRLLLANHMQSLSLSLDDMLSEFKNSVNLYSDLERVIRKALNKNSIEYKNVFCYVDAMGREKIKIALNNCGGGKYCSRNILPIITEVMRKPMCIGKDGCKINPNNSECNIVFEEAPKFQVVSYAAMASKEGDEYTGDTYGFGKTQNERYMTILSDGMGSGPEASKESKATVDIIERFIESGFSINTAVEMVNSIMGIKFDEDERFSTLDLNIIDLYTGEISFTKVGAVASFIKRGNEIKIIESNMPPFGLMDEVELEEIKEKLKVGDIVVTVSDGVVDIDKSEIGKYIWIEKYLKDSVKDPKELAGDIIEKAKELSGGKANDDMTVVVSKVYSRY